VQEWDFSRSPTAPTTALCVLDAAAIRVYPLEPALEQYPSGAEGSQSEYGPEMYPHGSGRAEQAGETHEGHGEDASNDEVDGGTTHQPGDRGGFDLFT